MVSSPLPTLKLNSSHFIHNNNWKIDLLIIDVCHEVKTSTLIALLKLIPGARRTISIKLTSYIVKWDAGPSVHQTSRRAAVVETVDWRPAVRPLVPVSSCPLSATPASVPATAATHTCYLPHCSQHVNPRCYIYSNQ